MFEPSEASVKRQVFQRQVRPERAQVRETDLLNCSPIWKTVAGSFCRPEDFVLLQKDTNKMLGMVVLNIVKYGIIVLLQRLLSSYLIRAKKERKSHITLLTILKLRLT